MRSLRPFFVLLLLAAAPAARATPLPPLAPYDLPRLGQFTLAPAAGGPPFRIVVASPAGPPPAGGYPVIYVVDGNSLTVLVSEIIRMNIGVGIASRVEPAVVVGIGYPIEAADDLTRREYDFTTLDRTAHASDQPRTGGDHRLMDFIDHDLKPAIEARFAVDRGRQTLIGHSLGGLFTLETLVDRPASFQTFVAISPSIWWNNGELLAAARRLAARPHPARLRVFLSAGDLEQFPTPAYTAHDRAGDRLDFAAAGKPPAAADRDVAASEAELQRRNMVTNVRLMGRILAAGHVAEQVVEFPGEDHFSTVPAALGRAVPFALGDRLPAWR